MRKIATVPDMAQGFGRVVYIDEERGFFLRVVAGELCPTGQKKPVQFILYPLTEIFEAHSRGSIDVEFPDLTQKDLRLCSAFLATNVPGHPAYIKNHRGKRVNILFDENLPYGLVSALTDELPNLSHVYLEGMDGFPDDFIYNRPWYHLKEKSPYERKKKRINKTYYNNTR